MNIHPLDWYNEKLQRLKGPKKSSSIAVFSVPKKKNPTKKKWHRKVMKGKDISNHKNQS